MKTKNTLVKLPQSTDQILYLIREELKSQKLFHILSKVGLYESHYHPHLGGLILSKMGFDLANDETMDFYMKLIDKRCKKIDGEDVGSLMKQAVKVYGELVNKKGIGIKEN